MGDSYFTREGGPTRTRTWDGGFGDRCFTAKLWTLVKNDTRAERVGKGARPEDDSRYDVRMRIRPALLALAPAVGALALFALPMAAHATGIPFFGPIVPTTIAKCAAGWGAAAQVVNNIIAFAITLLLLFVTPFMIAWAGFLYVVSPGDPSMRSKANSILWNTALGVAAALAAWLVINLLLATIAYLPLANRSGADLSKPGSVPGFTDLLFGSGGNVCIISKEDIYKDFTQAEGQTIDASLTGGGGFACPEGSERSGGTGCQVCTEGGCDYVLPNGYSCSSGTFDRSMGKCTVCTEGPEGWCESVAPTSGDTTLTRYGGGDACDAGFVSRAASDAGYSLTSSQANALGCISGGLAGGTGKEDSCGSGGSVTNYSWNKANSQGKASTAAGAYQLLLYTNAECWDNSVCQQTTGATGSINCKQGFGSNGFTAGGNSTILNQCLARAADNKCAAAAAGCLVKKNPSMSDWASPADRACKSKYGI